MGSNYAPMSARDLVFCDTETSTISARTGEIIEIAAIRTSPNLRELRGKMHRFCKMKNPDAADPKAMKVNRYDPVLWERHGVDIKVALIEFETLIKSDEATVFVAMNPRFDLSFIDAAFEKNGFPIPEFRYPLDVGSMAWPLVKRGLIEKIGLAELVVRYKIDADSAGRAHSAMADVVRLLKVYCALLGVEPPI